MMQWLGACLYQSGAGLSRTLRELLGLESQFGSEKLRCGVRSSCLAYLHVIIYGSMELHQLLLLRLRCTYSFQYCMTCCECWV